MLRVPETNRLNKYFFEKKSNNQSKTKLKKQEISILFVYQTRPKRAKRLPENNQKLL